MYVPLYSKTLRYNSVLLLLRHGNIRTENIRKNFKLSCCVISMKVTFD